MVRFDVYKGEELAATFVYGAAPRYFGADGRELASLIEATPVIYNLWTRETDAAPQVDRADWWAARIISAPLARAGFVLRSHCAPLPAAAWWLAGIRQVPNETCGLRLPAS